MDESKPETKQNIRENEVSTNIPTESKVQLLFHGLLSISFLGFFMFRELWIGFIFAHIAAISIMGFYGCLAGAIAKKKGYQYWRAFQIGFFLPIILGAISAFTFVPESNRGLPLTCGGWVCLGTGLGVVIFFLLIKRKQA